MRQLKGGEIETRWEKGMEEESKRERSSEKTGWSVWGKANFEERTTVEYRCGPGAGNGKVLGIPGKREGGGIWVANTGNNKLLYPFLSAFRETERVKPGGNIKHRSIVKMVPYTSFIAMHVVKRRGEKTTQLCKYPSFQRGGNSFHMKPIIPPSSA